MICHLCVQEQKYLCSFEDNSDYVSDVQWSPTNPALFSSVDIMGRLDLWHLNHETEVGLTAGGGGCGDGGGDGVVASFLFSSVDIIGQLDLWHLNHKTEAVAAAEVLSLYESRVGLCHVECSSVDLWHLSHETEAVAAAVVLLCV